MIAFQPYNDVFHQLSNTAGHNDRKKQKDYGSHEKLGFCTDSSLYTEKIIHSTYFNILTSFPLQSSRDLRIIDRTLELCQGIHLSEDAACIIPGSLSQEDFASGQLPLQIAGHQKKPYRNSKVPSLDLFEERLHKYSDSSQCHLHRLKFAHVLATKPVKSFSYHHTLTRQTLDQPSFTQQKTKR